MKELYWFSLCLLGFAAAANFFMGGLVLRRFPRSFVHISFFFMTFFLGAWSLLNFLWVLSHEYQSLFLNRLSFACFPFVVLFFTLFVHLAPRHGKQRVPRWMGLLGLMAVASAVISFTPLIVSGNKPGGWGAMSVFGPLFRPYALMWIAIYFAGIVYLHVKVRAAKDPFDRVRLRLIALATWLPFVFGLPIFFIPYIFQRLPFDASYMTVLLPATSFMSQAVNVYAIMRYRLLDVRLFGRNAMVTVIHSLIHAMVIVLLVYAFVGPHAIGIFPIMFLAFTGIIFSATLFYPMVNTLLNRIFEWTLFRDAGALEKSVRRFSRRAAGSLPLAELSSEICAFLMSDFRASGVVIFSRDPEITEGLGIIAAEPADFLFVMPADMTNALIRFTEQTPQIVTRYEIEVIGERHPLHGYLSFLIEKGAEIYIPLSSGGRCVGGIFIARRSDGAAYSENDIRMLNILADAVEPALLNACMDERIAMSHRRYRELFERAGDAILIVHGERMRIKEANSRAEALLQCGRDEICGKSLLDFVIADNHGLLIECVTGRTRGASGIPELMFSRIGGSVFPAELYAARLEEGLTVVNIRDLSERKHIEEELLKMKKIESLGVLAGGLAHDFNNLLASIMGNVSLAKMTLEENDEPLCRALTRAEKACVESRNLTRQLLTFSRGGAPIKRPASIGDIVRETAVFTLRGTNAKCAPCIAEDLWAVEADEGQLSQVVQNLVINAAQAMPDGGTVEISAGNAEIEPHGAIPLPQGKYVRVSVRDSGVGIPDCDIPKIFDPYFTTKKKGSGLGLAIAFSVIKRHSGYITAESSPTSGTTFTFFIPASCEPVPARVHERSEAVQGHGRVLVMDDDEMLREVILEILTELGFEAVMESNGDETVSEYEAAMKRGEPYRAVILDLTVPGGQGGVEVIRSLKKIDPGVRSIVSSGYFDDPVLSDFEKYGFDAMVAKPFDIAELSAALQNVLVEDEGEVAGSQKKRM